MKTRLFIYVTIVLTLVFSLLGCEKDKQETKPEFSLEQADQISDENYGIYSLIINERYTSEKIVIAQNTKIQVDLNEQNYFYDYLIDSCPDFDTNLVKTHEELNQNAVLLGSNFQSDTKQLILISSAELSYLFDSQDTNNNWDDFYREYDGSNGIIRFTRIAFNEAKTQAILEIGHSNASLGGSGSIIYLIKQNGFWIIKDVIPTWIS